MTPPKPTWIDKPTPFRFVGQGSHPKLALVVHCMEGTLAACDEWFTNPAAQVSANYGIGDGSDGLADGEIHCWVDPEGPDAPWANGIVAGADAAATALLSKAGWANPNLWTVSYELAGRSGDKNGQFVPTDAQIASLSGLAAYHMTRFGIPFEDDLILGHYEICYPAKAFCPGLDSGQWVRLEAAIQQALAGQQPAPPPDPGVDPASALARMKNAVALLVPVESNVGLALTQIHFGEQDITPASGRKQA